MWRSSSARTPSDAYLVVGLGNPGPRYEGTRHNAGRMVVTELAERIGAKFKRHKANAQVAEGRLGIGGPRVVLARPNTFMNVSGSPVAQLVRFYSLPVDRIIVVHDDLDLPFESIKLKQGGGHGGHNGLRDILSALKSPDFVRVRVGVGHPGARGAVIDYVLAPFSPVEKRSLGTVIADAADAVELTVSDGLTAAQQRFHARA